MLLAFEKHNKLMAEAQEGTGRFTLWLMSVSQFPTCHPPVNQTIVLLSYIMMDNVKLHLQVSTGTSLASI